MKYVKDPNDPTVSFVTIHPELPKVAIFPLISESFKHTWNSLMFIEPLCSIHDWNISPSRRVISCEVIELHWESPQTPPVT